MVTFRIGDSVEIDPKVFPKLVGYSPKKPKFFSGTWKVVGLCTENPPGVCVVIQKGSFKTHIGTSVLSKVK